MTDQMEWMKYSEGVGASVPAWDNPHVLQVASNGSVIARIDDIGKEEIVAIVRREVRAALQDEEDDRVEPHIVTVQGKQSERINKLEHLLKSCIDFMENPSIAGNAYQVISAYAESLCKTARVLLGDEE